MTEAAELRFAANLKWLFTELPFERRFEAAAVAGFAGVEYPSPYKYDATRLRQLLADAGLTQVLINTPQGPPGSPTASGEACIPGMGQEFRDGVDKGLEYATELGSSLLHVVAGVIPDGISHERAFAQYVTNLTWAATRARGTGVRLVVEMQNKRTVPRFLLQSQDQAAAVVQALDEEVGLLFDVYHVQVDEGDVTTTLRRLLPLIAHIQIADPPDRTQPGTGELAWPFLFKQIRRFGYDGWIGCEYRPTGGSAESLISVKELTHS